MTQQNHQRLARFLKEPVLSTFQEGTHVLDATGQDLLSSHHRFADVERAADSTSHRDYSWQTTPLCADTLEARREALLASLDAKEDRHYDEWMALLQARHEFVLNLEPQPAVNTDQERLLAACKEGSVSDLEVLLKEGTPPEVNCVDAEGKTPLWLACRHGHADMVRMLIDAGATVNPTPPVISNNASWVFRFTVTEIRDEKAIALQLQQFVFYHGGDVLQPAFVDNPDGVSPANGLVRNVVEPNGDKWISLTSRTLVFVFHSIVLPDSYAIVTADDHPARDPIAWRLEALDTQTHRDVKWKRIDDGEHRVREVPMARQTVSTRYQLMTLTTARHKSVRSPLATAVCEEHDTIARLLIAEGAHPDQHDTFGLNALDYATQAGNEAMVQHLIMKAGASLHSSHNARNPLQLAAANGHLQIVRMLLNAGVAPDERTCHQYGWPALFHAAKNGHNAVVELLLAKGADANIVDFQGNSALHLASTKDVTCTLATWSPALVERKNNNSETPLLLMAMKGVEHEAAVHTLVVEFSANCNHMTPCHEKISHLTVVRTGGMTPLYAAAATGSVANVRLFVDHGVDVNNRSFPPFPGFGLKDLYGLRPLTIFAGCSGPALVDAVQRDQAEVVRYLVSEAGADVNGGYGETITPLHIAARRQCEEVAKILIDNGGRAPGLISASPLGRIRAARALIHRIQDDNLLLEPGAEPPNQMRLYVGGFQGVGKTTLVKSLQRSISSSLVHWSSSKPADRENPEERTPGMNVQRVNVPSVGHLSIWDFAGHVEYYITHGLLMGAGLFLVLCNLSDPPDKQHDQIFYWLRFISARFTRGSSDAAALPTIIVAGSTRDSPHPHSKVCRLESKWRSVSGDLILNEAQHVFKKTLRLVGRFFCLDCRRSQGVEMAALRKCLNQRRAEALANAEMVPRICAKLIRQLPTVRSTSGIIPTARLVELAMRGNSQTGLALAAIRRLSEMGEVVYIQDDPMLSKWVIVDPQWFGQTVLGRVLAPATVAVTAPQVEADGVVTRAELKRLFWDVAESQTVVTFLQHLEVCFPIDENDTMLLFPALLKGNGEEHVAAWTAQAASAPVLAGRRLECVDLCDMLPPQFFPRLQSRMAQICSARLMWRNGTMLSPNPSIQALIEISPSCRQLDVVVRCKSDDDRAACLSLMRQLVDIAVSTRNDIAPGTHLYTLVLGIDALKQSDFNQRVAFTVAELEQMDPESTGPGSLLSGRTVIDMLELGGKVPVPTVTVNENVGDSETPWVASIRCISGAEIAYTLDGTIPDGSSTRLHLGETLRIPAGTHALRVRGFKRGMAHSDATITIPLYRPSQIDDSYRYYHALNCVHDAVRATLPLVEDTFKRLHKRIREEYSHAVIDDAAPEKYVPSRHLPCVKAPCHDNKSQRRSCAKCQVRDAKCMPQDLFAVEFAKLHYIAKEEGLAKAWSVMKPAFKNNNASKWDKKGQHFEVAKLFFKTLHGDPKRSFKDLDGTALFNMLRWCTEFHSDYTGDKGLGKIAGEARNMVAHENGKLSLESYSSTLEKLRLLLQRLKKEDLPEVEGRAMLALQKIEDGLLGPSTGMQHPATVDRSETRAVASPLRVATDTRPFTDMRPATHGHVSGDHATTGATLDTIMQKLDKVEENQVQIQGQVAALKTAIEKQFDDTRALMVDIKNVTVPFLFEFLTEAEMSAENDALAVDKGRVDGGPGTRDTRSLKRLLKQAQAFFNRAKKKIVCKAKGVVGRTDEKLYLRLICGKTFEPVVTYSFVKENYSERAQAIAAALATPMAVFGIMTAYFWNPAARVVSCFGIPVQSIEASTIAAAEAFLHEVSGKHKSQDFIDLAQKEGGGCLRKSGQLHQFAKFLEEIEGLPENKAKKISWRDKMELAIDENDRSRVRYVSSTGSS